MTKMLPYNVPAYLGTELDHVRAAIEAGHLSGNGTFTRRVHRFFEREMGFPKVFLTHSCTGALEMAALLLQLQPGDEVILPTFTHVGTANAFVRAGATLRFADSLPDHPNVDPASLRACISPRTRAVVVVHYAGVLCEMDVIREMCDQHGLVLIEDAAHAIGARYQGRAAGSFGDLAAFSFHETKNIQCGQGGLLVINDLAYADRAAVLWENGTNRAAFFAGLVDQYTWVDQGACFLPSEMNAAFLYGQLEGREGIFARRLQHWEAYHAALSPLAARAHGRLRLPVIPPARTHNAHIYYVRLPDRVQRDALMQHLRACGFLAVFHYVPLHSSPFFTPQHDGRALPHAQAHSDCILRLPLFDALRAENIAGVCAAVGEWLDFGAEALSRAH
jgi:dTDP-4-amino-4,6-dideoxygalactose transaminase